MITLKVPSISCQVCAKNITTAIKTHETSAEVVVDVANQLVSIESHCSVEELKQIIIDAGHEVA